MHSSMQTVFVIYDRAMEHEVRAIFEREMAGIPRYSRIGGVIGARMVQQEAATGYKADRRNRMIVAVAEPAVIARITEDLRALRTQKGHGLRAFVVPLVEVV